MKTIKIIFWAVLALMLAAVILFETNEQLTQAHNVCELQRNELALSLIRAGLEEQAINIVGRDLVVLLKFSHDIELSVNDKALIIDKLQK